MLPPLVTGHPLGPWVPRTGVNRQRLTTTHPELVACSLGRNELFGITERKALGLLSTLNFLRLVNAPPAETGLVSTRIFTSNVNVARAETVQLGLRSTSRIPHANTNSGPS